MGKIVVVSELKALPDTRVLAQNVVTAKLVSFEDLQSLFSEEIRPQIRDLAKQAGVTHVVAFENLDMWSSQLGARKAMIVGSKQRFSIDGVLGIPYFRIGDVPSRFMYPVAYAGVEAKAEAPAETAGQASESRQT